MASPPPTSSPPPPPSPPFIPDYEIKRREYASSQLQIEGLLIFSFGVVALIVLFGILRTRQTSRVSNALLKTFSTMILFPGANKLTTYVPGLMDKAKYTNEMFALWTGFFAYLVAISHKYTSFRFGENEDRRTSLLSDLIFPWGAIAFSLFRNMLTAPQILVPVAILFWLVVWEYRQRRDALNSATRSTFGLITSTKVIYDYMGLQQKALVIPTTPADGTVESGDPGRNFKPKFKYLLGVREAAAILKDYSSDGDDEFELEEPSSTDFMSTPGTGFTPSRKLLSGSQSHKFITLDDLTVHKDELQKIMSEKLNDTCLAFASFWLLLAKAAGHDVSTDILDEIIPQGREPGAEIDVEQANRTFNLIEVELGYLYDYLYTNYYALYAKGLLYSLFHFGVVLIFLWLTLPLLVTFRAQEHSEVYVRYKGHVLDNGITRFVVIAVLLIELTHLSLVLTSNWAKVAYVCAYIRSRSLKKKRTKFLEFAIKIALRLSFHVLHEKKVDQYSLMESYNLIPPLMCIAYFAKSLNMMDIPKVGQRGNAKKPLHPRVKKAFINTILKSIQRKDRPRLISNGTTFLAANDQTKHLSETYIRKLDSHSQVIIVWHIATDRLYKDKQSYGNSTEDDREVAITVSQYCAYLLVFVPKFLPDSGFTAQCAFDKAVKEIKQFNSPKDGKDRELEEGRPLRKKSLLELADDLENEIKRSSDPWKLLADFWTEMLLYVALSNNFEAIETHADFLCIGGQLITHLWALVNHAGCLRDPDVKPRSKTREDE